MATDAELDPNLLVQPVTPGSTIPEKLGPQGLFLLNFGPVLCADVWDDYGNKELAQARRLRGLVARITAIADAMDQLGDDLRVYPDVDDYQMGEYKETWDVLWERMQSTLDEGYIDLAGLVDELADAAIDDFMD